MRSRVAIKVASAAASVVLVEWVDSALAKTAVSPRSAEAIRIIARATISVAVLFAETDQRRELSESSVNNLSAEVPGGPLGVR